MWLKTIKILKNHVHYLDLCYIKDVDIIRIFIVFSE